MRASQRRAGTSAANEFKRLAALRRRRLRIVFIPAYVICAALAGVAYFSEGLLKWWLALVAGAGIGVMLTYRDSPPQYIESWRQGIEGERSTARRLSRLPKRDWRVWHDITLWGASNIDHVVVGNAGIYLLDSKQYFGAASLEHGVLRVEHFEEASGFYKCRG